jgi:hypothetical protein
MLLEKLISQFDSLWPPADKEDWDKPGLMLGSLTQDVKKVLLSVDITHEVIEEARLDLSERPETVLFCGFTDRLFVGERSQIEIVDLIAA